MKKLLLKMKELLINKHDIVLVNIITSSGSTPRGSGARMIVDKNGLVCGTIGGGEIEYRAEHKCFDVLAKKSSCVDRFILMPNEVADLGMICGGDVEVFFQYISGCDNNIINICDKLLSYIDKNINAWLVTGFGDNVDSTIGLFTEIEGPICLTDTRIVEHLEGQVTYFELDNCSYYIEQVSYEGNVYIFGGGHLAQELVPILSHLNFRCVVVDDRPKFTDHTLFPMADKVKLINFEQIYDFLEITKNDYVCIMTRGHQFDTIVQKQVLSSSAKYIGVVGSKHKKAVVEEKLRSYGFKENDINRIETPIGISIKAETPAEIAISIAAQLIECRSSM